MQLNEHESVHSVYHYRCIENFSTKSGNISLFKNKIKFVCGVKKAQRLSRCNVSLSLENLADTKFLCTKGMEQKRSRPGREGGR